MITENSVSLLQSISLRTILVRFVALLPIFAPIALTGCALPEYNRTPPHSEEGILSNITQLTRGFDGAGEAYFSRDMKWIIFQAYPTKDDHRYQMYVAPLDIAAMKIGEPVRISPENSRNTCGFFSPDGSTLIFASTAGKEDPNEPTSGYQRKGGNYRWSYPNGMEIYRADGWQQTIAGAKPGAIVDLAKHALTDNHEYDAEGSISPDGKWIVFTSKRTGDLELYAMRIDGSNVVRLTHSPGYDGGPFFSPNGKQILYRSDRKGNDLLQVYISDLVFDRAGNITGMNHERKLTHDDETLAERAKSHSEYPLTLPPATEPSSPQNVNWGPFWHPDGVHIIYATSMHGHTNYELYLMRSDGSHKTRITFKNGPDVLPVFSPDGNYIMWCSRRSADGTPQIILAKFTMPKGA